MYRSSGMLNCHVKWPVCSMHVLLVQGFNSLQCRLGLGRPCCAMRPVCSCWQAAASCRSWCSTPVYTGLYSFPVSLNLQVGCGVHRGLCT
jgi:hypothetical protein